MSELAVEPSSRLFAYRPEHIPEIWSDVKDFIQSALIDNGHLTIEDIYNNLLLGHYQLWTPFSDHIQAAFVTAIYDVRGVKNCTIIACGGTNLDSWKHFMKDVEDWAREDGCTSIKIYGRRGWAKIFGFDIVSTELRKEL